MLKKYFQDLYSRTMHKAYQHALLEIADTIKAGGHCLDCGANKGSKYQALKKMTNIEPSAYFGIEWNEKAVLDAQKNNMNIVQGDLNIGIQFPDNSFRCVFGLSVLEHLLNPCHFLKQCHRVLEDSGRLVILTPNISTYFTAALILLGKMPSSGPHPDSEQLLKKEEIFKISDISLEPDPEKDNPVHRHLIVFSYRVLISYMKAIGFKDVAGYGFGLYPFPNFLQPVLERIDPYHCHQMVLVAQK